MPNKVRTIFMVIHSGFGARYLLRSDIFKVLKSAGIRIVILTPNADEAYFRAEFEDDRVIVEQLEIEKCREYRYASKIQSILQEIRQLTFSGGIDVSTLQEKLRVYRERSDAQTPKRKLLLALILF